MYSFLLKLEIYLLFIILAVVLATAIATYLAYAFFGWVAVPVPTLLIALALWARIRYLR